MISTYQREPQKVAGRRPQGLRKAALASAVGVAFALLSTGAAYATTTTKWQTTWYTCTGSACLKWTGVAGYATAIDANKQVQIYGDRFGTDPKTQWFTTKNVTYQSGSGYLTGNTPKHRQR